MKNNNDLEFVYKRPGHRRTSLDVDLSLTLINSRKSIALSFSQKAFAILGCEYIVAAKLGNRLYFKPADGKTGYMLSGRKAVGSSRMTTRIPAERLGITTDWIGYYNLLWDRERDLFYVANDHELKFKEAK
jgi:hypothetical protein